MHIFIENQKNGQKWAKMDKNEQIGQKLTMMNKKGEKIGVIIALK